MAEEDLLEYSSVSINLPSMLSETVPGAKLAALDKSYATIACIFIYKNMVNTKMLVLSMCILSQ